MRLLPRSKRRRCLHGHPFTRKNTHLRVVNGRIVNRVCRVCDRLRARAAYGLEKALLEKEGTEP